MQEKSRPWYPWTMPTRKVSLCWQFALNKLLLLGARNSTTMDNFAIQASPMGLTRQ